MDGEEQSSVLLVCWALCMAERNPPDEEGEGHQKELMRCTLLLILIDEC